MSQPSPDARHVARAVDALTTQVRRIANAVSTPVAIVSDAPTTTADDASPRRLHHWFPMSQQEAEEMNESASLIQQWAAGAYVQARAAEEDEQRTARRASLRVILDRASRGVILRTDEAALLRQHVDAEQREVDTARAELEQAQAAIKRVRSLLAGRWGAVDPDLVRAALDGTEQPTTEAREPLRVTPCNPPRMAVHCGGECLAIPDSDPDRDRADRVALVGDTLTVFTGTPGGPAANLPAGAHYIAEVFVPRALTRITASHITSSGLLFYRPDNR